jgi:aerobic-type carbon monoxide dehydrogenase small subunit (CoxS/CutS family)
MVLTIHALLEDGELTDEASIRHGLAGNLCRCTGYRSILAAVRDLVPTRNAG